MKLRFDDRDDLLEIFIEDGKRLDAEAAWGFRDALLARCGGSDKDASLDLGAVELIDSSGLSALLRCHRALLGQGRKLLIRNVGSYVSRILSKTRLDEHLFIQNGETARGETACAAS